MYSALLEMFQSLTSKELVVSTDILSWGYFIRRQLLRHVSTVINGSTRKPLLKPYDITENVTLHCEAHFIVANPSPY